MLTLDPSRSLQRCVMAAMLMLSFSAGAQLTYEGVVYELENSSTVRAYSIDTDNHSRHITIPSTFQAVYPCYDNGFDTSLRTYTVVKAGIRFSEWTDISEITIGEAIDYSDCSFDGCPALTAVHFPAGTTELPAMSDCPMLDMTLSWLPETVEELPYSVFSVSEPTDCPAIIITPRIRRVGDYAFNNRAPRSIVVPELETNVNLGIMKDNIESAKITGNAVGIIPARRLELKNYDDINWEDWRILMDCDEILLEACSGELSMDVYGDDPHPSSIIMSDCTFDRVSLSGLKNLSVLELSDDVKSLELTNLPGVVIDRLPAGLENLSLSAVRLSSDSYVAPSTLKSVSLSEMECLESIDLWNMGIDPEASGSDHAVCFIGYNDNLKTLVCPDRLECMPDVIYNKTLTSLTIGSHMRYEREQSVHANPSITEVIFGGDLKQWLTVDRGKFAPEHSGESDRPSFASDFGKNWEKFWYGHGKERHSLLEDLHVNNVDSITYAAFYGYKGLRSVEIDSNVKLVGAYAFEDCANLKTADIAAEMIHTFAFANTPIETLRLSTDVRTIVNAAFSNCGTATTKVYYAGTPDQWNRIDFAETWLTAAGEPARWNRLDTISPSAFAKGGFYFQGVLAENIVFSEPVDKVSLSAFCGMKNLSSVVFTVYWPKVFGYKCFAGCSSLGKVELRANTAARSSEESDDGIILERFAFEDCSSLADIPFIGKVSDIGEGALSTTKWFADRPDGVVYAGDVAYAYKGSMPINTALVLRAGTVAVAPGFCQDQTNICSIELPEGLRRIGQDAFSGLSFSGVVTIPSTVDSIAGSTFWNSRFDKLVFADSDKGFAGSMPIANVKELYIGRNTPAAWYDVPDELEKVTFGEMVTEVGLTFMGSVSSLTSLAVVPPACLAEKKYDWNVGEYVDYYPAFNYIDKDKCTLYVPAESIDAYKAAEGWKDFYRIEAASSGVGRIPAVEDSAIEQLYDLKGNRVTSAYKGVVIVRKGGKASKEYR